MGTKACKLDNRRLHIRTSDEKQKKRWFEYCEGRGQTISELVRVAVEGIINPPEDMIGNVKLKEDIADLNDRLRDKERELEICKMALDNKVQELESVQQEPFAMDIGGVKDINNQLVQMLRGSPRLWSEMDIFMKLEINQNDIVEVKALGDQLRWLVDLELIEMVNGKWRWVG